MMDSILPKHIPLTSTNTFTHDFYGMMPLKIEQLSLNFSRGYGFGANLFYLLWELVDLKAFGLVPTKITAHLRMYNDYEFYNNCFNQNHELVQQWMDKDVTEIFKMRYSIGKSIYGLGSSLNDLTPHLDNLNLVFNAYFNFKQFLYDKADMFIKENNLDTDAATFIWWRKGNKPSEVTDYPTYAQVVPLLIEGHTNILQTDDVSVLEEFKGTPNLRTIDALPIFNNDTCIDSVMHASPQAYEQKYNKEYCAHVPDVLALAIIASRCKRFIGYPGHISQLVCFLRRDFNKQAFIIKNNQELF